MLEFPKHYSLESNKPHSFRKSYPQVFCYSNVKWTKAKGRPNQLQRQDDAETLRKMTYENGAFDSRQGVPCTVGTQLK